MAFPSSVYPWNEALWQQLTQQNGRTNHALLLNGEAGLGKLHFAMAYARQQMVQENVEQNTKLLDAGSHPDFHVIMPEACLKEDLISQIARRYIMPSSGKTLKKNITIDQIRQLKEKLTTHPHLAAMRVIIIAHADKLNRNAANALLKSLEEPPQNTLFLLVCNELSLLAQTIRSRCSLVSFRAPNTSLVKQWLIEQGVLDSDLETYVSLANGCPLQVLDMLELQYVDLLKTIFTDINALWAKKTDSVTVAKNWQTLGAEKTVNILQKIAIDLLRYQLTDKPASVFFPIQASWLSNVSKKLDTARLTRLSETINQSKRLLQTPVDELLLLESLTGQSFALPK